MVHAELVLVFADFLLQRFALISTHFDWRGRGRQRVTWWEGVMTQELDGILVALGGHVL